MSPNARVRWIAKPTVFALSLAPLAWVAWQAFNDGLGANPIEALNRYLGEWGLKFLMIALAVTPLRRLTGWATLTRFRRMMGLFAFAYVLLHLTSYVVLDHFFNWAVIWSDIVKRTFITVGMLGVLLLLPLAITSTKGMIKRLGGKRWQALHRIVYVAGIAGVVHFYMMVKADVTEPLVYAGILSVLLGSRLVVALRKRAGRQRRRSAGAQPA